MKLKSMLEEKFGSTLPVSGGMGRSIDDAIILHRGTLKDYVSLIHYILRYITSTEHKLYRLKKQSLIKKNGRVYDCIEISTTIIGSDHVATGNETYYFDITEQFPG
jgi:hypothetical protein